jgi:GNAT superfamily N-acetyltransferase
MSTSNERSSVLSPDSLTAAASFALAQHVRVYDDRDRLAVHAEPGELRLVYVSVRATRLSRTATFMQFRVDEQGEQMWITGLQVSETSQRQGLGREMVHAAEDTARRIGASSIKIWPLVSAVGFWESMGYRPDARMSRVLCKEL